MKNNLKTLGIFGLAIWGLSQIFKEDNKNNNIGLKGNLSPYKLKHAIVKPVDPRSVLTQKDVKVLDPLNHRKRTRIKSLAIHTDLTNLIKRAKGNLSKDIYLIYITDKQYGEMNLNGNNPDLYEEALKVATKKQKQNIKILR